MLTVVEEPRAQEALDNARERWSRADDAWDALTWTLARDPDFGTPITESGRLRLAVLEGAESIDLPTLEMIYEVEGPYLIVREADFRDPAAPQAGTA